MFRSKLEEKLGDKTENPSMVVQITETKPLSRSLQTHHLVEISKNQHSLRGERGRSEARRVRPGLGTEAHPENNGDLPTITKKGIYGDRREDPLNVPKISSDWSGLPQIHILRETEVLLYYLLCPVQQLYVKPTETIDPPMMPLAEIVWPSHIMTSVWTQQCRCSTSRTLRSH